jgi:hypothetical protein
MFLNLSLFPFFSVVVVSTAASTPPLPPPPTVNVIVCDDDHKRSQAIAAVLTDRLSFTAVVDRLATACSNHVGPHLVIDGALRVPLAGPGAPYSPEEIGEIALDAYASSAMHQPNAESMWWQGDDDAWSAFFPAQGVSQRPEFIRRPTGKNCSTAALLRALFPDVTTGASNPGSDGHTSNSKSDGHTSNSKSRRTSNHLKL